MAASRLTRGIALGAQHVGPLRNLPVLRLLAVAEVILLARDHVTMLEPAERRRLVQLVRLGRGRRRNLTAEQREELEALVAKAQPRLFLGEAASRISPVPLPRRVVEGPRRRASRSRRSPGQA
jgi:hypothetical protein